MMRFKSLTQVASSALLVFAFAAVAAAQVATLEGKVLLEQADKMIVPLQGATVHIVRTDIKQDLGSVKTDKNGKYVRVGVAFTGTYTLLISAPNSTPAYLGNVRPGQRAVNDFTLYPGDGRVLTLEDAKAAEAAGGKPAPAGASAADVANAKKKASEIAAERAKYEAERAKAEEYNAKVPEILKAGNEAYNAKNFDLALAKYDEGIVAAPEEHVFPLNKAVVLTGRGIDKYNAAFKAKDNAAKEIARAELKTAVEFAEKAVTLLRAKQAKGQPTPAGTAAVGLVKNEEELSALNTRADSYRLALLTYTPIDSEAAAKAIEEYVNVEPDANKKNKMQAVLGEALLMSNKVDESIAKFRQILSTNPNNVDAMRGLGISLAAKANEDPKALAEAVRMMEQFVEKAPADHKQRPEVAAMAEELKGSIKELDNKPQAQEKARPARRRP
jgi:tetratricopeptide (TPR) repeat protein